MVAHHSYHGSYRFCYISRGTPGGTAHSVLLLHGFTANKDSWLPIIKVPASVKKGWVWRCVAKLNQTVQTHHSCSYVLLQIRMHCGTPFISHGCICLFSSSISPKTGMWCVWTCQVMRERVAQGSKTTASRVRSAESTRSVWVCAYECVCVFLSYVPKGMRTVSYCSHRDDTSSSVYFNLCSLFRASALINSRSTWLGHPWVEMLQGCMLPNTPPTCAASLWFAHQVNSADAFHLGCVLVFTSRFKPWDCLIRWTRRWTSLSSSPPPPGLLCPTETQLIIDLRKCQERQQIDSVPLIPFTIQELRDLQRLGCYKPANLPQQVSCRAGTAVWEIICPSPNFSCVSIFG